MLLINARLEPVETPAILLGYLQIKDGIIAALGRMEDPLPKDSEIYDLVRVHPVSRFRGRPLPHRYVGGRFEF